MTVRGIVVVVAAILVVGAGDDSSRVQASDDTRAEAIQLEFSWPADLSVKVETRRGQIRRHFLPDAKPKELGLRYTMTTREAQRGLHVSFDDLKPLGTVEDGQNDFVKAVTQFAGLVPDFRVSSAGEFLEVESGTATADRMRELIVNEVPELEGSRTLSRVFGFLTSTEFLTAVAAKQWENMVEWWIGRRLVLGVPSRTEESGPHPLVADSTVKMTVEYSADRRVPCFEGAEHPGCVRIEMRTAVDTDDMNALLLELARSIGDESEIEKAKAVRFTEFTEQVVLVTEPETLLPHRFEYRKTVDGSAANGANRDGRVDYQITTFRYP